MNESHRAAREKWRQIIKSQRGSGLSIAAYCRERGIGQASFFAWKRRLRPGAQAKGFVEVKTAAAAQPAGGDGAEGEALAIEVCLGGGRRLLVRPGFDRELLVAMIGVLEGIA